MWCLIKAANSCIVSLNLIITYTEVYVHYYTLTILGSKNPVENDVFSQIHPKQKLPSGVKERKFNLSIFRKVIWKD